MTTTRQNGFLKNLASVDSTVSFILIGKFKSLSAIRKKEALRKKYKHNVSRANVCFFGRKFLLLPCLRGSFKAKKIIIFCAREYRQEWL